MAVSCMCDKVSVCRKGVLARFGKNLVGECSGMVWYEACGWCMVWWHGCKSLVGECVGMVWYEACAWYMHGGMAGKSLVSGSKTVGYEACGWCMVWWHGW